MKGTIKSLIFIASMFIFLGLFVFFGRAFSHLPTYYLIAGGLVSFLLSLGVQGLLKQLYIVPRMKKHGVLMSFPVKSIGLKDRVTAAVLPFFAIFSSWFYTKPSSDMILPTVVLFVGFMILLELLLKLGEFTMRIHFTTSGVAVSGYDFRPEYTLPFPADNLPGIYEYDRIVNFIANEDTIVLTQYFDSNRLIIKADEDTMRKIVGLLMSKNILPEKQL